MVKKRSWQLIVLILLLGAGIHTLKAQKVKNHSLYSKYLKERRNIQVQLPKDYAVSDRAYPVLIVLDGEYVFDYARGAASFLSNAFGFFPQLIVVGIPNTDRNRDLFVDLKPDGPYLKFISFLEHEVLSFIKNRYRSNGFEILYGWSSGAGIVNYIAVKNPKLFNAYILAGAGIGPKTEAFIKTELKPESYTQAFLFASAEGSTPRAEGLKKHRALLQALNPKGLDWEFKVYENQSHVAAMSKGLYDGLEFVFKSYHIPESITTEGAEKVINYYRDLKRFYGYQVEIPEGALNEISSALQPKQAIRLLDYGLKIYPKSSLIMAAKAGRYLELGDGQKAKHEYQNALKHATSKLDKHKYHSLLKELSKPNKN
ncbi:alpha/beta hydrolase [Flagellimonas flava]|uniref:alpha/beta hydrolase n=1 Tax=Flagellimonas flava TaxID=570519 RepID=UPI0013F4C328|nr:alpha/beta hydrolase-fold protein [Allomuricauda flava]